MLLTNAVFLE